MNWVIPKKQKSLNSCGQTRPCKKLLKRKTKKKNKKKSSQKIKAEVTQKYDSKVEPGATKRKVYLCTSGALR